MAVAFKLDFSNVRLPDIGGGAGDVADGCERFVLWTRTQLASNSSGDLGLAMWRPPRGELWVPQQILVYATGSGSSISQWTLSRRCAIWDTSGGAAEVYRPETSIVPWNAVVREAVRGGEMDGGWWWTGVPSFESATGDLAVGTGGGTSLPFSVSFPYVGAAYSSAGRPLVWLPGTTWLFKIALAAGWSIGDFFSVTFSGYRARLDSLMGAMWASWVGG